MKNTNAFIPCLLLWLAVISLGLSSPTVAEAADPAPPNIPDISCPPASGTTVNVPAGGDFQVALNAANPGDVITLAAGATFTGLFTLPNKSGNGPCITIRTSAPDSALPAPGTRMTPEYAAAGVLPKIVSPGSGLPALQTAASAHHFQIIGVEILPVSAGAAVTDLVKLGTSSQGSSDVPHHLVFDRVYIHGWPDGTLRRCILLQSASTTISNSSISQCARDPGFDTQAIGGFNGPGPFRILNNYLEGASENLLFGGNDPSIPNLVPSDIEIRHNHFAKQLAWMSGGWNVKNLFELKNAQRVLVDGNIFEYNWADGQSGYAIVFTPRNQNGNAPWSVVQDVTFTNNIVRHSAQGVSILGSDSNFPSGVAQRILIMNNLFEDVGGTQWPPGNTGQSGNLFQINIGPQGGPIDLAVKNNTAFHLPGTGNEPGGNTLILGTASGVTEL